MTPDQYTTKLATIREAAANAGRDPMAITPGFSMFYAVAASETEAEQLPNSPPLRCFALPTPHSFWAQLVTPVRSVKGFAEESTSSRNATRVPESSEPWPRSAPTCSPRRSSGVPRPS